jgi:hypothetical protein
MSIIFGVRKPAGAIASEPELLHLAQATTRYAIDGVAVKVSGRVGMGFQPYYTHQRSRLEHDPAIDMHGNLLTFDGRLDNYADLSSELGLGPIPVADSQILLAAFLRWGTVASADSLAIGHLRSGRIETNRFILREITPGRERSTSKTIKEPFCGRHTSRLFSWMAQRNVWTRITSPVTWLLGRFET